MEMFSALVFAVVANPAEVQRQDTTYPPMREIRQRTHQLKDLQRVDITVAEKHKLNVWVMDQESKRQEGMMFLREGDFNEKQGMLFAFIEAIPLRFWMKNTYVPLDIAYLNADGTINSIYTMKAFDTTTDYSSRAASMYALETKDGWFKKNGVKVGDKVAIPSTVKGKD